MTPGLRLLSAERHTRMPWKNGGGLTTEIAVHPADASLDMFGWRVSRADVARDGPFSRFPNVDRSLAVLGGNGLRLTVGTEPSRALTIGSGPFFFPADLPTYAELIDGPTADLNVMTRRGQWRHTLEKLSIANRFALSEGVPHRLLLCHQGEIKIDTSRGSLSVNAGDAVYWNHLAADVTCRSPSIAFLIEIWAH